MFENLPETMKTKQRGRGRAFSLAVGAHAFVFSIAGVMNLLAVEAVEPPAITVVFLSASAPPPPPPPPAPRKRPKKKKVEAQATPKPVVVPVKVPEIVQPEVIAEELPDLLEEDESGGLDGPDFGVDGGVEGGIEGGVLGGTLGGVDGGVVDEPLRVGGDVEPPQIISQVKPRYPEVAKAARVQGIVILEAIINTEGKVDDVRVLRGHPLLEQAAKDAIVKWKFRPGRLNGKPVKVYFTLTVNFTLK